MVRVLLLRRHRLQTLAGGVQRREASCDRRPAEWVSRDVVDATKQSAQAARQRQAINPTSFGVARILC